MRSLLGRGQRKSAPVPKVREATVIAVPLSFITQGGPLTLGQTEGSSVPRAPGRTSHSAPRARFQPTARPLCPGCGDATLSDPHAMHRDLPIHFIILTEPAPRVKARVFAPHRWYAAPSTPLPGPDPRRRGAASPTPRRWAVDQPGVPGMPGGNPPPFSFWRPKKKTAVEPSKEKTLCRRAGTDASHPPTRRDAARNCSAHSGRPPT